jgi:DnaJ-class molecular chaperone
MTQNICHDCEGSGKIKLPTHLKLITCTTCNGSGKLTIYGTADFSTITATHTPKTSSQTHTTKALHWVQVKTPDLETAAFILGA